MAFLNMGAAEKGEAKGRDSRRAVFPSSHGRVAAALQSGKTARAAPSSENHAMLRFAANVSMLFPEAPFLERFALAARAGFAAVECQFPYAAPAREIRARLDDHGLAMVLHNLPAGD